MRDYSHASHQNTWLTDLLDQNLSSSCWLDFALCKQSIEHQTWKEATWPSLTELCCPAQVSNYIIYTVMPPAVSWHQSALTWISQQNLSLSFSDVPGTGGMWKPWEITDFFPLFTYSSTAQTFSVPLRTLAAIYPLVRSCRTLWINCIKMW